MQALHQAQFINHFGDFREDLTDPLSTFAMLGKAIGTFHQIAGLGKLDSWFLTRIRLAVITAKGRLVVEGVDLRRPTVHEQEDDSFGPGGKPGEPG